MARKPTGAVLVDAERAAEVEVALRPDRAAAQLDLRAPSRPPSGSRPRRRRAPRAACRPSTAPRPSRRSPDEGRQRERPPGLDLAGDVLSSSAPCAFRVMTAALAACGTGLSTGPEGPQSGRVHRVSPRSPPERGRRLIPLRGSACREAIGRAPHDPAVAFSNGELVARAGSPTAIVVDAARFGRIRPPGRPASPPR